MTLETRKAETPQSRMSGLFKTDLLSQQMVGLRNRIQGFVGRETGHCQAEHQRLRITQFGLERNFRTGWN